jgi:hypothetical protein
MRGTSQTPNGVTILGRNPMLSFRSVARNPGARVVPKRRSAAHTPRFLPTLRNDTPAAGVVSAPAAPRRSLASNDRVAKSLNLKDNPVRPTTVISTSAWPLRSLSTRFAREEKSHTATRSRLSAPRAARVPFCPGDTASPRNHVALGDLSSRDHGPCPHRERLLVEMTLQTVSFLLQRRPRHRSPARDDETVRAS